MCEDNIVNNIPNDRIIPFYDKENIPDGWHIANGENNTYDLSKILIISQPIGFYNYQFEIEGAFWIQKI